MSKISQWLQRILKVKEKLQDSLSIYKAQIYLIESIDISKFSMVYKPAANLINITSPYSNIVEYTIALKMFIKAIVQDNYIAIYEIKRDITPYTLRSWFIVKDTYIDPTEAIKSFLEASKEFIELHEHYSTKDDISFNNRKNINNTQVIINNLFKLLEELKNVQ